VNTVFEGYEHLDICAGKEDKNTEEEHHFFCSTVKWKL